ncbi:MAG: tetratricopeptide repeat protein [Gammaproteobacteria bacterium]|nr:tetratricopeptide repeat protein [Gammaproteobacteria bacterium]
MEADILGQLKTIQALLWVILAVTVVCAAILVLGVIGRNLQVKETLMRDLFSSEAKGLEDRGDFQGLASLSKARIEKYPKDIEAWYYLAIARLRSKNYQGALDAFAELQTIDPHWQKEAIQGYINDVRESMRGPVSTDA